MGKNEYNWIDDPFDEKKNAQLEGMGKGSKTAFVLGVLALAVVIVLGSVLVFTSLLELAAG